MFKKLFVLSCATAAALANGNVDPKLAKILKEQRFNAGDGRTGSAYATENGHIFREESDLDGNRIGQYSYVGDDGQTYTVKYSAGVDGFRILSGDHIPSGGQEAAAFNAELAEEEELTPEVNAGPRPKVAHPNFPARPNNAPIPVRAPAPQRTVQQPQQPQFNNVVLIDEEEKPAGNPFINPHDPTHRNFQFNKNAATFDPENPEVRQASLVPPCADCEGVNPFINPFDNSHQALSGSVLAGHLAGFGAGQPAPRRPAPAAPIVRPQALPRPAVVRKAPRVSPAPVVPQTNFRIAAEPTAAPRNFFPPGELTVNRFENGFTLDFASQ